MPRDVRGVLSGLGPCSSRRSRPLAPLRRCGLTLRRDRRVAGALRLGKALQRTRKGPPKDSERRSKGLGKALYQVRMGEGG